MTPYDYEVYGDNMMFIREVCSILSPYFVTDGIRMHLVPTTLRNMELSPHPHLNVECVVERKNNQTLRDVYDAVLHASHPPAKFISDLVINDHRMTFEMRIDKNTRELILDMCAHIIENINESTVLRKIGENQE